MNDHLGVDILIQGRDVSVVPTGDVDQARGLACIRQDVMHRIGTPKGDLWSHPDFGFDIQRFMHLEATEANLSDFRQSLQETVEEEPRVVPGSVTVTIKSWDLDTITFRLTFRAAGVTNPVNLVLGYDLSTITLEAVHGS
jgi:phage baseplate assembly protein W